MKANCEKLPGVTKYRQCRWGKELIEAINVTKETAQCVWIDGTRENKRGWYKYQIYDTWELVRASIVEGLEQSIVSANERIAEATKELAKVRKMKPPKASA